MEGAGRRAGRRERRPADRFGEVLAEEEVEARFQELAAAEEEEEAPSKRPRGHHPSPPQEPPQELPPPPAAADAGGAAHPVSRRTLLANLFVRALQTAPELARALAEPDGGQLIVRTPQLAARDIANTARAFSVRATDMSPCWGVLARALCPGLPERLDAAVYVPCARGVVEGVRRLGLIDPIGANAALVTYNLTRADLTDVARLAPSRNYNLTDVQRVAWLKHGDAAGVAHAIAHSGRERERLKREARRAEVHAALAAAGLDAALAFFDHELRRYVSYGSRDTSFPPELPTDMEARIGRARRGQEVAVLLDALDVPADFVHNMMAWYFAFVNDTADPPLNAADVAVRHERCYALHRRLAVDGVRIVSWNEPFFREYIETGAPAIEGVVSAYLRPKRLELLLRRLSTLGLRGAGLGPCSAFLDGGGSLDEAVAAVIAAREQS